MIYLALAPLAGGAIMVGAVSRTAAPVNWRIEIAIILATALFGIGYVAWM